MSKRRWQLKIVVVSCITFIVFAGCVTAPAQLVELGSEQPGPRVSGDAMYAGWWGLSLNGRTKPEAYEIALFEASELAVSQGYSPTIENTKLWTTTYASPQFLVLLAAAPVVALAMQDAPPTVIDGFATLLGVLISGLEVERYTIVGEPVPK